MKLKCGRDLRKCIRLLRFDKLQNSLLTILYIVFMTIFLSNFIKAVSVEQDDEKYLTSIKDIIECAALIAYCVECSRDSRKISKLIDLIDSDFPVSSREVFSGERTQKRLEKHYKQKINEMESTYQTITVICFLLFLGFLTRSYVDYLSRPEVYDREVSRGLPTPFLSYIPHSYESTELYFYIYFLQALASFVCFGTSFFMISSTTLAISKLLADFETIHILVDDLTDSLSDVGNDDDRYDYKPLREISRRNCMTKEENLRKCLMRIVECHQTCLRRCRLCVDCSAYPITLMNFEGTLDACISAFMILQSRDPKKFALFAVSLVAVNFALFFIYNNGQRIFNQNDILRKSLASIPWTNKPQWFKTTLLIMMTRANVDIEIKPYGIYVLNYVSFKDMAKAGFSIGNIFYTRNKAIQSQK